MGAKLGGPGGGSRHTIEGNAEINVTPMVDVMLVLLIIFMVSAPLATVSIKLDLPPAQSPPGVKPKEPTYISIQQSGALYIGTVETGLATLAGDLARVVGGSNPTEERIFVRADAEVKYFDFMSVMNALQDGGYYQVALVNEDLTGV